jgi:dienelactone hydrolase
MAIRVREVSIPAARDVVLDGNLSIPDGARAIVLFAHGAGSSRFSPRNQYVASMLLRAGLATLLMDLLTGEEEEAELFTRHLRFNIELLASRVVEVTQWLSRQPATQYLAVGYFGASTGAAAALVAAANQGDRVGAIVSRGGRPDLAGDALPRVRAPTLLIVGAADTVVLELNREAFERLQTEKKLEIIPGATHLFEEPGALERVAELATEWFLAHLPAREPRAEEAGRWP